MTQVIGLINYKARFHTRERPVFLPPLLWLPLPYLPFLPHPPWPLSLYVAFIWAAPAPSAPQMCYFPEGTTFCLAISHVTERWSIVSSTFLICVRCQGGWAHHSLCTKYREVWLPAPSHSLHKTTSSLGIFRNPSRDFYFFKLSAPQNFIMKNFKVQS